MICLAALGAVVCFARAFWLLGPLRDEKRSASIFAPSLI